MKSLLLLSLVLPAAAAVLLMLLRARLQRGTARWIALGATIATLALVLGLADDFRELPAINSIRVQTGALDGGALAESPVRPRFEFRNEWLTLGAANDARSFRLEMRFGLDGVSLALVVLTAVLTTSCVLGSWESIRERDVEFYACLLLLECGLIGVFCAFDLVLFYVFFEFTLIPLFFLIGIWGGPQRRYAAIKFFLYTFVGSMVTLVGLVAVVLSAYSAGLSTPCSIPDLAAWLTRRPLSAQAQTWLFLAISTGFMIKVPLFPVHTWLPLAHVEAPTAGSVLLAGVLLKLGTYGFFRLCLPLFPTACQTVGLPLIAGLAVVGIVYGSLCALAQRDIKKLVAYSSVAHLGFCMLGLFALNAEGISGAVLQMINHGLSTGGLFLLVGMIYDRYHTRQMDELHGLASRLPLLTCAMVFICMASIGLPGLNGFVGEILSLAGMFKRQPVYAVIGASGIVLGAWYLLTMLQHVFFGPPPERSHPGEPDRDLNARELLAVLPICALCLWIGVRPQPLLETIKPDVNAIAALYADGSETSAIAGRETKMSNIATTPLANASPSNDSQ